MAFQTVFDQRNRNAGTFTSPPQAVSGITQVSARALLSQPDLDDATLIITFVVEHSNDGGANWRVAFSGTWTGGLDEDGQPRDNPMLVYTTQPGMTHMRATVTNNQRVSWGLEMEVL